jgi:hypothetical protein
MMTKDDLVKSISNGMFGDRDNLKDAFDYVADMADSSGNPMAVWTAVMVVTNTIANEIKTLEV